MREMRAALVAHIDKPTLLGIFDQVIKRAKRGDLAAARLILGYVVGQPESLDLLSEIEELEARMENLS